MPAVIFSALAALLLVPVLALVLGVISVGLAYASLEEELNAGLDKIGQFDGDDLFETTRIYDRDGILLREMFGEGKRTYIPLSEMPQSLIQATIATEDKTFYDNPGIDVKGITRAVVGELTNTPAGGGSTITQQLARRLAFSYEERSARSYRRKAKEIVIAYILTERHEKDQILEWYLNEIYYGNLAYGIEAASQVFFDKSAKELTLEESALLAGLPQAPADLDPLSPDENVQAEVNRRYNSVLTLLQSNGYIDEDEFEKAKKYKFKYRNPDDEIFLAPHFVVYAEKELEALVEEGIISADQIARGGLEVVTSIDMNLQLIAEREIREQVDALRDRHNLTNASLVALEPATGQIMAMVGSYDYWNAEIDGNVNVALRERQPGSSIKPITYLTAIERGVLPSQVYWDVPMELPLGDGIEPYRPVNYDGRFRGPVRMRASLANSFNIPALKALGTIPSLVESKDPEAFESYMDALPYYQALDESAWPDELEGVDMTVATARKMGISGLYNNPWHYGLSLTLGGGEVTLMDMTRAYATMANMGRRPNINAILRITDPDGEVLYDLRKDEEALESPEVVDPRAAYIVTDMLSDNRARQPSFNPSGPLNVGIKAAAKTGTTNDYRDNWTVGYTPYLVVGVWAGNSDNSQMINSSGVTGAAPIWNGFLRNAAADKDKRKIIEEARSDFGFETESGFERPKGIISMEICRVESLRQPVAGCPEYQNELFIAESAPEQDTQWMMASAAVIPAPQPPPPVEGEVRNPKDPKWQKPSHYLCQPGPDNVGSDQLQSVAVVPFPGSPDNPTKSNLATHLIGDELNFSRKWAVEFGWSGHYPAEACRPELMAGAIPPGSLPSFLPPDGAALAFGADPQGNPYGGSQSYQIAMDPGSNLNTRTEITGTAFFDTANIDFFKIELGSGTHPNDWITLGDIHRSPVVNGVLEVLDAPSLPHGPYVLRLVLVQRDGNVLEPPHSVPINIGP